MSIKRVRIRFEDVLENILNVMKDEEFQKGVQVSVRNFEVKVREVLKNHPEIERLAEEVREIKKKVLENLDEYLEMAINSMKRIGAQVYVAETADDAREIVGKIVGTNKLVVMSKSMIAEELGLREHLEDIGNEVWETDLGQFLVQLEKGKPMHPIAPAIHISRKRAARLLRERLGIEVSETEKVENIVKRVREFLRTKIKNADVGISGANSIAADTGAIFLVENEGNIRLVTGLPPKHIVVTGIEKIVPSMLDAFKTIMVQAANIAIYPPTYIDIIAGPSSTADIEQQRVFGAQGPVELYVVLVDNGRRRALSNEFLREQLRCLKCGRCLMECPVWRITANVWGGPVYGGPMGINWTAITIGEEEASELAHLCLLCGRCTEVCPMDIPLHEMIRHLKHVYNRKHNILK